MTYEETKSCELEKFIATPGNVYQRFSDGKYVRVLNDGTTIELRPDETEILNKLIAEAEAVPEREFDGDVFAIIPVGLNTQQALSLKWDAGNKTLPEFPRCRPVRVTEALGLTNKIKKDDVINAYIYLNSIR